MAPMLHWQISRGRRAHDDPSVPRKGRVFLLERRIPPWHMDFLRVHCCFCYSLLKPTRSR
jgi:hypothetical protein